METLYAVLRHTYSLRTALDVIRPLLDWERLQFEALLDGDARATELFNEVARLSNETPVRGTGIRRTELQALEAVIKGALFERTLLDIAATVDSAQWATLNQMLLEDRSGEALRAMDRLEVALARYVGERYSTPRDSAIHHQF